jgi:hypothetical protein
MAVGFIPGMVETVPERLQAGRQARSYRAA